MSGSYLNPEGADVSLLHNSLLNKSDKFHEELDFIFHAFYGSIGKREKIIRENRPSAPNVGFLVLYTNVPMDRVEDAVNCVKLGFRDRHRGSAWDEKVNRECA
ncbi:hypothetical protein L596_024298 [Steinernema carpocapsae]|uniref:Uncharacterized protein n=1 Tax=Steinernema carpocapsae TaxID=34508 RepID=A0A4U5MGC4_STECR|nr:hypothetical protein L596_024298 [Steinernema carpocapsae]